MFHLEDPDPGDYFVVSVFSDPEYQTPIFIPDGGASSCLWEVDTAHRSSPSITSDYIGPEFLAPDDPGLFRVTLQNRVAYYQNTPVRDFGSATWATSSVGY